MTPGMVVVWYDEQRDNMVSVQRRGASPWSKMADDMRGHEGSRHRWGDVGGFQHQKGGCGSDEVKEGDRHIAEWRHLWCTPLSRYRHEHRRLAPPHRSSDGVVSKGRDDALTESKMGDVRDEMTHVLTSTLAKQASKSSSTSEST